MGLIPQNQVNLANYIPTVWAKELQEEVENQLVFAKQVDRRFEKYASFGNKIVVPKLSNIGASAFNAANGISLTRTTEGCVNIDIDQRYYVAYGVDDFTVVQDMIGYLNEAKSKAAYGIALKIDDTLAYLVNTFGSNVGTEGSAITEDTCIAAYEALNEADAPETDRSWILDPESITDLLGRDYFVRMDYVPEGVVARGFQGRQIFGAPVYMTNNLQLINSSKHGAAYIQREVMALVMQMQPTTKLERIAQYLSDAIVVEAMWGVKLMRGTFGVWIKTRS